jgi:hypothetical protein
MAPGILYNVNNHKEVAVGARRVLMFCKVCGNPLREGDLFCSICGSPVAEAKQDMQWPWKEAVKNAPPADAGFIRRGMEPKPVPEEEFFFESAVEPPAVKPAKADFEWNSEPFETKEHSEREEVNIRWDVVPDFIRENVIKEPEPSVPQAAVITQAKQEQADAEKITKRVTDADEVFTGDIEEEAPEPIDEVAIKEEQKHEEFQALLDEELEKLQSIQKEEAIGAGRIEHVMEAPIATPVSLVSGETYRKTAEERIAEFLQKADEEMLSAIEVKIREKKGESEPQPLEFVGPELVEEVPESESEPEPELEPEPEPEPEPESEIEPEPEPEPEIEPEPEPFVMPEYEDPLAGLPEMEEEDVNPFEPTASEEEPESERFGTTEAEPPVPVAGGVSDVRSANEDNSIQPEPEPEDKLDPEEAPEPIPVKRRGPDIINDPIVFPFDEEEEDDIDALFDELENGEGKPGKGGKALTVIIYILVILAVLFFVCFLILKLAPDSGAAKFIDSIIYRALPGSSDS